MTLNKQHLEKKNLSLKDGNDLLELTRRLIAFDTINPPGQEKTCAHYVGDLLAAAGFVVTYYEYQPDRTSLIATLRGDAHGPAICFSGHLDTVPLGAEPWNTDPLGGTVVGDQIFGRGTSDMKSGLAAMIAAALRIARTPNRHKGLTLIFTAGEESGCQGAEALASHPPLESPIGAVVVGEPTSNYPYLGHKGALWLEAETRGITAHGSMPEKGDNAVYKAARAITRLETYTFDISPHPFLGSPTLNVGTVKGGQNINSVPDQAGFTIDIRTIPEQHPEEITRAMKAYLGEDVTIKTALNAQSVATAPEHPWVQSVYGIVETLTGEKALPKGATYFTDAGALNRIFEAPPILIFGPGEPSMAHKTDEFCYISKIQEAAQAYYRIAREWCCSQE